MKKFLKFLFVSAFALLCVTGISSCSKDDDDQPIDSANIIGAWLASYAEWWEKENGVITDKGTEPEADPIVYDFHENGKVDVYDDEADFRNGIIDHTSIWKIKGDVLTIWDEEDEEKDEEDRDEMIRKIESIGSETLVLSQYHKEKEDGVTFEEYYKTTFIRLK